MSERYDAIVVGARCAGSTLATLLARAGWRVLLVDRDPFPSDTVSTHVMFPDTLQRLDEFGALAVLEAAHDVPRLVNFSWRVLGHEVAGEFTPVGDYDRATCVRRIVARRGVGRGRHGRPASSCGPARRCAGLIGAARPGPAASYSDRGADRSPGCSARTGASRRSPGGLGCGAGRAARRDGLPAGVLARAAAVGLVPHRRARARGADVGAVRGRGPPACPSPVRPELTRGSTAERERRYRGGAPPVPGGAEPAAARRRRARSRRSSWSRRR